MHNDDLSPASQPDDVTRPRPGSGAADSPLYRPPAPLLPGSLVGAGRYRIVAQIGAGGAGETYTAINLQLLGQVPCVVKRLTLPPGQQARAQIIEQLKNEAHVLKDLRGGGAHARIPDMYDVLPDELCLVMTAISGVDLDQLLKEQPDRLTAAQVIGVLDDVCTTLVFLHNRPLPLVHQDIKPKNLVRDASGNTWLTDFGISETLATLLRQAGQAGAGSDGYSPPEQLRGESEEGSDIYALAMTAAVLLNQRTPQQLDREAQIAALRQQHALPSKLIRLIADGLALDVRRRPTAERMLKRVRRLRAELAPAVDEQPEIAQINSALRAGRSAELAQLVRSAAAQLSSRQRAALIAAIEPVAAQLADDRAAFVSLSSALAELSWRNHDYAGAITAGTQALQNLPPAPAALDARAYLLKLVGTAYGDARDYTQAESLLAAALECCSQIANPVLESQIYNNIGRYADETNQPERAMQAYTRSLELKEQTGDLLGIVKTLNNFGLVAIKQGQLETIQTYYQHCRDVCKQLGRMDMVAAALAQLGGLYNDYGSWSLAQQSFAEAERLFAEQQNAEQQAFCLYNLGDIALEIGDRQLAANYGRQALALVDERVAAPIAARAWRVIGQTLLLAGQLDQASTALEHAWQLLQTGEEYDHAFVLLSLAELAYAQADTQLASERSQAALALANEQNIPSLVAAIQHMRKQS